MHTAKSLKAKKIILYFHTTNKTFKKNYVLACILALITSLLKSRELGQYLKIIQKIILFSFYIRDYEFTCKMYSRY
jgi:hypothetical protein